MDESENEFEDFPQDKDSQVENESENEFYQDSNSAISNSEQESKELESESDNSEDLETIDNTLSKNNNNSSSEEEKVSDDEETVDPTSKAAAIEAQLETFDQLVDVRIRLQPFLNHFNYEQDVEFNPKLVQIHNMLVDLQHELGSGPKKRKFEDGDDITEWIESTDANYDDWKDQFFSSQFDTLKHWEDKVTVEDVKKFKVIDTSVVSQLKNLDKEKPRLQKKSRKSTDGTEMDIYDDHDFYQSILKDLVERRVTDPNQLSVKMENLRALQKKKKKTVDTKASKGRRIRYNVQEKILNFMAPETRGLWHEQMAEELFLNLFGTKVEKKNVVVTDGFKLF